MAKLRGFFNGGFFLALFIMLYPVIFLYSHNAKFLLLSNLVFPVTVAVLLCGVVYGVFRLAGVKPTHAGLSTVIFYLVFLSYGFVFRWLQKKDLFPVEHYTLAPLMVIAGFYIGAGATLLKEKAAASAQKILLPAAAFLILVNIVQLAPVEIAKARQNRAAAPAPSGALKTPGKDYPDIYFIILDEYAGFDAIREYWHDDYVNQFDTFLKSRGFFVAEKSHSGTISTMVEIASRLNLKRYKETADQLFFNGVVTDNKVFRVAKSYGYTTVVLNRTFPPFAADFNVPIGQEEASQVGENAKEFRQMLVENSMLLTVSDRLVHDDDIAVAFEMIKYSIDKTTDLGNVGSPKLVYAHYPLPHMPFVVDEAGNLLDAKYSYNWQYYLGQHKYTTQLTEELITKILANYPADHQPVIILQSDHGARNGSLPTQDSIVLQNYPVKYKKYILNALLLPGYDTSQLPQDLDPTLTFQIVLNHYLDAGVTVDNTPQ